MTKVEYEDYKGHDLIRVFTGKTYKDKNGDQKEESICFGVRKAQAICEQIDQIRKFAERGDSNENTPF